MAGVGWAGRYQGLMGGSRIQALFYEASLECLKWEGCFFALGRAHLAAGFRGNVGDKGEPREEGLGEPPG